ncbi:hypothetical protein EV401DRAFT_2148272 [Pisolithus croceorrhizus]|nr:hypothetical protein EV401DRAFT_2148272 [Pisolithus croceorrhizus]
MHSRPDKPLLVKCTFDGWNKRISFASARNCSYDLLRERIEQCFSLSATPYVVSYRDDDGEVTDITTESDLTEAIQYFQAGSDDPPLSSAASILSGRSFGSKRITLRVQITVDYDGPSLSDTSSLASLDEYKGGNESSSELSWVGVPGVGGGGEFEDDTVTVSSRDNSGGFGNGTAHQAGGPPAKHARQAELDSLSFSIPEEGEDEGPPNNSIDTREVKDIQAQVEVSSDRLSSHVRSPFRDALNLSIQDRGAAWLRDQNARTIRAMLGTSPEPSDWRLQVYIPLVFVAGGKYGWGFSVTKGPKGKDTTIHILAVGLPLRTRATRTASAAKMAMSALPVHHLVSVRPSSMQLSWLASQQKPPDEQSIGGFSSGDQSFNIADIPPELLPLCCSDLRLPRCANYVLGMRRIIGYNTLRMRNVRRERTCELLILALHLLGSTKRGIYTPVYTYPPSAHLTPQTSSSSSSLDVQTLVGSLHTRSEHRKPLPPLPGISPTPYSSQGSNSRLVPGTTGYELCSGCIEGAGIYHALQESTERMDDLRLQRNSPEDALSLWWRSAPRQKGKMRHAYFEKVWGPRGWEDVEQEDMQSCKCSTCNSTIVNKRFKCASCKKFNLCRACYNQVHDIHPAHAFLIVLGKPTQPRPEVDLTYVVSGNNGEACPMKHPGVKCAHCLQDIVGARFHCAICDSVDICSNCEAVGLPGNLDPSDGGHTSSHIMIKIPYPLESNEVRTASRHAIHLWTGRDAAQVLAAPRSKPSSVYSSYAQTIVGSRMQLNLQDDAPEDHRINCNGCTETIFGIRYQCATCPSSPTPYSLCTTCEERSYLLHDPMHSFFKLPRPVRRPLESSKGFLPKLYKVPAGPLGSTEPNADPKEYLSFLVHSAALCDRCMERIRGAWHRCAYCAKDLCGDCEAVDTHDETHVFVIFKAPVDMPRFRQFANVENPSASPPLIPFPVYF